LAATLEATVNETTTKETADALPEDVKVDKPAGTSLFCT